MSKLSEAKVLTEHKGVTIWELERPLELHGVAYPYLVILGETKNYHEIISDAIDHIERWHKFCTLL